MSAMSYEAARKYIAGEEFDKTEFERQHIIRLTKSVTDALTAEQTEVFFRNTMRRAERYIKNHIDTPCKAELRDLMRAYLSVADYYDAHWRCSDETL